MSDRDGGTQKMLAGLLESVGTTALDHLPDAVIEHAKNAGLTEVRIYLGDVERRALHLLPGRSTAASAEPVLPIEGTLAGRAYQYGRVLTGHTASLQGVTHWVPLADGLDRVGAMLVTSTEDSDEVRDAAGLLAALVALVIVSKRGHSDTYTRLNRTQPMNVAAEAQWQLMPPRSYKDSRVAIGATLEPSYQISGDAYDYSIDGSQVRLAIFDAMGHDTAAGQIAALALAADRSARHQGATLAEAGEAIEHELVSQFGGTRFATAVLASLDTRTGLLSWASFGHHPVLVIRGADAILLPCRPAFPLGTGLIGPKAKVCHARLEPGDRITLYTDGILEQHRPGGREFGLDRLMTHLTRHHDEELSVPEIVRRFVRAFLDFHGGRLRDDSTVLLCEWPGPTVDD